MVIVVGLVFLGLILHISTICFALPVHLRARLAERLAPAGRDAWLTWLDHHDRELHTLASLLRLTLSLAVLVTVWVWQTADLGQPVSLVTAISSGLITIILLALFAIGIPHAVAQYAGETVLAVSLPLLYLLRLVLWPVGQLFNWVEFIVRRLLGQPEANPEAESERVEQEILDAVSEGEAYGAVDEDQKEMIKSVIELKEIPVSTIMTPRTDINAVPVDATYDEVRTLILEKGHSRIPVFEGSIDHIIGVVYAKDLLRLDSPDRFDARRSMRTVPYVPETKTIDELLEEFRATKVQIAIVLDEYGGTAGLATIEDILEELVGEIDDEYDQRPPPAVNRVDGDTLDVDARVHVSEINEELGIALPEGENYETIGGFVFASLGKIPTVGEHFQHENVRFDVVSAEARKINRLRIHVARETAETA